LINHRQGSRFMMKITWVSSDRVCSDIYRELLGASIECLGPDIRLMADVHLLVVDANGGYPERENRVGLNWLRRFVRETRSNAPTVVYSFESIDEVSKEFAPLKCGLVGFLRLPFEAQVLTKYLKSLSPLTQEQVATYIRWHCDLQKEWRESAHDLSAALVDWPAQQENAQRILTEWASSILSFAPDQKAALSHLKSVFGKEIGKVRAAIQILEDGLCRNKPATVPEAPKRVPPEGYSTIMIADDQGYEEQPMQALRRLGYHLSEVARNLDEAESLIRFWAPKVVLADLNFPSRSEGLRLIKSALDASCLVIVISRARVGPDELPSGVEDCSGGSDFQDVERIHRLIWRHAQSAGAS
jgi:hypothetical protein